MVRKRQQIALRSFADAPRVVILTKSAAISESFSDRVGGGIPGIIGSEHQRTHYHLAVTSTSLNQQLSDHHP